ncbi:MAG: SCO family protein [Spongiibacteraceae bacterium]
MMVKDAGTAVNKQQSSQKRGIFITVAVVLVFMVTVIGLFIHGLNRPQVLSNEELKNSGVFLFDTPRSFKDFSLLDDNNQAFTAKNLLGKWSLVFFGFTYCPDICPTTMAVLNQFYQQQQAEKFGKDLQIIMVSVDPARDTPEKLHDYVRFFNQDFVGVTGEFLDLHRFATQLNIPFSKVPGGGENYTVEHSGNVAIINSQGHYVGFFRSPLELAKLNFAYHGMRAARE